MKMKIITKTLSMDEIREMAAATFGDMVKAVVDIKFNTMINVRPSQGNRSRGVEDEGLRKKIVEIVDQRVSK
jgi:hypothetical protein